MQPAPLQRPLPVSSSSSSSLAFGMDGLPQQAQRNAPPAGLAPPAYGSLAGVAWFAQYCMQWGLAGTVVTTPLCMPGPQQPMQQMQHIRADISQQGAYHHQQQPSSYGGPAAQYNNHAAPLQQFEYGMAGGQMAPHVEPHMLGPASGMPGADVQPLFQPGPTQVPFHGQQQQPLNGNSLHQQDLHECAPLR